MNISYSNIEHSILAPLGSEPAVHPSAIHGYGTEQNIRYSQRTSYALFAPSVALLSSHNASSVHLRSVIGILHDMPATDPEAGIYQGGFRQDA